MRTLLIDNYDSFTYNLHHLISLVNGVEPVVVRNDEVRDVADLDLASFDNIVIGPGPGHPANPHDFGVCAAVIRDAPIPLLGVCLGHQGIVLAAGGVVERAARPRHGYVDRITHDGSPLFAGIPSPFRVVRYHSLGARTPLPAAVRATAWSPDGTIMAVTHATRPRWGVQFHPESVASEFGERLLRNFAALTGTRTPTTSTTRRVHRPVAEPVVRYHAQVRTLPRAVGTEAAFVARYATAPTAFWLDSASIGPNTGRFSYLGDATGPLAETVRYRVGDGHTVVGGVPRRGHVLDYLAERLAERAIVAPELPFDFVGGYVGYLGYETKALLGAAGPHRSATPDACWIFADRLVVVDHQADRTYLIALDDGRASIRASASAWLDACESELAELPAPPDAPTADPIAEDAAEAEVESLLVRGRDRYLADTAACRERLLAGDSYEICLTDRVRFPARESGLAFYRALRRVNPAPYAAFLRFAGGPADAVEIACSSPERFLRVDRTSRVEAKPIKGTARRGDTPADDARRAAELAADPKAHAENLMIVDLVRNDLGRVCEVGSVDVPSLLAVESYQTVHQLVSTIRGRLRPGLGAVDCLRACFPGGSMTGAPKLRTMAIIDRLEGRARGVYSGTVGFLSLNGTADLNIVIRTAVRHRGEWWIGSGGAIVLDSVAEDEFGEMVLKAASTLRARQRKGQA